ncbi:alpha/beta hydrolase [Haloferax larsenii]|uniref:Alpha/beta hydrolase n=1 Tax=Haloferax larsenii TaxID=302484 RepID=A0ABY5RHP6_HALLR|nr:alpha/beta hydrolase-fold protein [Haloferax larsenii]ELZ74801.1 putative hydrolase of alpha/beta superfamily protein [Haloferax larsenii JCM 13917]UVE51684.1 alpha/beta hydrolase [Haloferax larsenii]
MLTDIDWRPYDLDDEDPVDGDVRISDELSSEYLDFERHLLVYLPPDYDESNRRYPVCYMHDGQNVFDEATSYSGSWDIHQAMDELHDEGLDAIVVGVPNAGDDRTVEYTPHPHPEFGGGGADSYLQFLFEEVKPLVDETFRTRPEKEATGLLGSSLGGLISLYALFEYPQKVGFLGAMSPAFWWSGEEIFEYVEAQPFTPARIYVDVGDTESMDDPDRCELYIDDAARMVELLREKGYDDVEFLVDEGGVHREHAWARRFPGAMRFLLDDD